LQDLHAAYTQLENGHEVKLPPKTSSYQQWAEKQADYVRTGNLEKELSFWLNQTEERRHSIPRDFGQGLAGEELQIANSEVLEKSLGPQETRALLEKANRFYRAQMHELLLLAVAEALTVWSGTDGAWLDVEGHGREEIWSGMDVSRTVGWFTNIYPLKVQPKRGGSMMERVKSIREQVRRVPRGGIGYGMLRYLGTAEDITRKIKGMSHPEVLFNYLGQFEQPFEGPGWFELAEESPGPLRSLGQKYSHLLMINISIVAGSLNMRWIYSRQAHRKTTIENLANNSMKVLTELQAAEPPASNDLSLSDFSETGLTADELDKALERVGSHLT